MNKTELIDYLTHIQWLNSLLNLTYFICYKYIHNNCFSLCFFINSLFVILLFFIFFIQSFYSFFYLFSQSLFYLKWSHIVFNQNVTILVSLIVFSIDTVYQMGLDKNIFLFSICSLFQILIYFDSHITK